MVLNPLADNASIILTPLNFSFSTLNTICTFLLQQVDIRLHDQDGKVAIEYLHWIIEHLILNQLILTVLLNVLGEDLGLALHQQLLIALADYGLALVVDLQLIHLSHKSISQYC